MMNCRMQRLRIELLIGGIRQGDGFPLCSPATQVSHKTHKNPYARNNHDEPGNDSSYGGDKCGQAVGEDGAKIAERFANRSKGAAGGTKLGTEGDFDSDLFGFVR